MSKMICPCHKVTRADIRDAIKGGCSSFKEVKAKTKVGKSCGKCKKKAEKYVEELLKK